MFRLLLQPPKKDTKGSSKQPQKTQKKKEGGSGGKAKKKVRYLFSTMCDDCNEYLSVINLKWCVIIKLD